MKAFRVPLINHHGPRPVHDRLTLDQRLDTENCPLILHLLTV
jgi:hypothetical protein